MAESHLYAVYFFPQALEALGETIKPYLTDGPSGPHVLCAEIDSGGPFFEMTLLGTTSDGRRVELEVMVPLAMVRCVVSMHEGDSEFGFG
jgi:hypothetical protein